LMQPLNKKCRTGRLAQCVGCGQNGAFTPLAINRPLRHAEFCAPLAPMVEQWKSQNYAG